MLDNKEFRDEVSKAIKEVLAEVSAETRLDDKVKTLLESADSTISDLLETVEAKSQEVAQSEGQAKSLKEQLDELVGKTNKLEEMLSTKDTELKESNDKIVAAEERAVAAEAELTKIAHDRRLEVRVAELAEAKILKVGEKAEAQKAKVREMSDEEYASYKEELIDLRQSVEAALKEISSESGETTVEVAPPVVKKEEATTGAPNVESSEPAGKSKFQELGQALAKKLKSEK